MPGHVWILIMPDSQPPPATTVASSPSCPAAAPTVMRRYWRRNLLLIGLLLAVWSLVTFIPAYFARSLSFDFIGWPFAFWMAAYGAPLAYLVLIAIYARVMNRADARARQDGEQEA